MTKFLASRKTVAIATLLFAAASAYNLTREGAAVSAPGFTAMPLQSDVLATESHVPAAPAPRS